MFSKKDLKIGDFLVVGKCKKPYKIVTENIAISTKGYIDWDDMYEDDLQYKLADVTNMYDSFDIKEVYRPNSNYSHSFVSYNQGELMYSKMYDMLNKIQGKLNANEMMLLKELVDVYNEKMMAEEWKEE